MLRLRSAIAIRPISSRFYHSVGSAAAMSSPSTTIQSALGLQPKATELLIETLDTQVPKVGFTEAAITGMLRENGYSDAGRQVFPNGRGGVLDLVLAHLARERARLFEFVTKEDSQFVKTPDVIENVSQLVKQRIRGNEAVSQFLPEILATLAVPSNVSASMGELHNLSDDIWYLAGDDSHDFSWYTRRMVVSSLYVSTELFMSQDKSSGFRDTYEFLDRRLAEAKTAQYALSSVSEWAWFNGMATMNIIKAQLSRG